MTYCSCSLPALPIDVLQQEWWVPGSTARAECAKFQGKDQFREILAPSVETTRLWVQRATQEQSLCQKIAFSQKPQNQVNEDSCVHHFLYLPTPERISNVGWGQIHLWKRRRGSHCGKSVSTFAHKKTGVFLVDVFSTPLKWTIKQ